MFNFNFDAKYIYCVASFWNSVKKLQNKIFALLKTKCSNDVIFENH